MANPRPEKVAVVDDVRSRLDQADAVIVTEYRGLKVKDLAALRRSLAPLGGEYRIFKNTLVRIAADQDVPERFRRAARPAPRPSPSSAGDAAAVTKALRDFARANPLMLIKGGLLGRSVLGAEETVALADLPSREVLLARLAGGLAAPLQSLAGLLAALPRNFAYGLAALRDQRAAGPKAIDTRHTALPRRQGPSSTACRKNLTPNTTTKTSGAQDKCQPSCPRKTSSNRSPSMTVLELSELLKAFEDAFRRHRRRPGGGGRRRRSAPAPLRPSPSKRSRTSSTSCSPGPATRRSRSSRKSAPSPTSG